MHPGLAIGLCELSGESTPTTARYVQLVVEAFRNAKDEARDRVLELMDNTDGESPVMHCSTVMRAPPLWQGPRLTGSA